MPFSQHTMGRCESSTCKHWYQVTWYVQGPSSASTPLVFMASLPSLALSICLISCIVFYRFLLVTLECLQSRRSARAENFICVWSSSCAVVCRSHRNWGQLVAYYSPVPSSWNFPISSMSGKSSGGTVYSVAAIEVAHPANSLGEIHHY